MVCCTRRRVVLCQCVWSSVQLVLVVTSTASSLALANSSRRSTMSSPCSTSHAVSTPAATSCVARLWTCDDSTIWATPPPLCCGAGRTSTTHGVALDEALDPRRDGGEGRSRNVGGVDACDQGRRCHGIRRGDVRTDQQDRAVDPVEDRLADAPEEVAPQGRFGCRRHDEQGAGPAVDVVDDGSSWVVVVNDDVRVGGPTVGGGALAQREASTSSEVEGDETVNSSTETSPSSDSAWAIGSARSPCHSRSSATTMDVNMTSPRRAS